MSERGNQTGETTPGRGRRIGFLALGWALVGLGAVGAVLPVMPTTIFLIGAVWAFGRSSPRIEARLLNHPRFGPALTAWREGRAISRRGKVCACAGMTAGYAGFLAASHPPPWLAAVVLAAMAAVAIWLVRRPDPRVRRQRDPLR